MKYSVTVAVEYNSPFSLFPAEQWKRALYIAAKAGFEGVELCISDYKKADPLILKKSMDENHLICPTISTGQAFAMEGFSLLDTGERLKRCKERFFRHIEAAAELNSMVTIGLLKGSCATDNIEEAEKRLAENLYDITEFAKLHQVTILLEGMNRYESSMLNTVSEVRNFIQKYFSDTQILKILWDSFHANIEETRLGQSIEESALWLGHVHFADSNRLRPGLGHIPFQELFQALERIDYTGFISYECLPEKYSESWWNYLQIFQKKSEMNLE